MGSCELAYVAGYGRSGSTLLDLLLGNHPECFGAGEVTWLFDHYEQGQPCSCGERLPACPFWREVFGLLESRLGTLEPAAAARVTRRAEAGVLPGSRLADRYGRLWRATFDAIKQVSGARVVVDSSKSTRKCMQRLSLLGSRVAPGRLAVIHLVRDPRGVLWSIRRGSNRALEAGRDPRIPGGACRGLLGWSVANALTDVIAYARDLPLCRVRYEELVSEPLSTLARLGSVIGLDVGSRMEHLLGGAPLSPGHGVSGNRMRRGGATRLVLKPDVEWRTLLPRQARLLALCAWPLLLRYEYAWWPANDPTALGPASEQHENLGRAHGPRMR